MRKWGRSTWLYLTWLLIVLVIGAFSAAGIRMSTLSRDALQYLDQPFYVGMLSQLGVLAWGAAACVVLFASFHLKAGNAPPERGSYLRWIGTLTLLLMLDDLLMLHEQVFPVYLHLPETALYVIYLAWAALLVLKFWRLILTGTAYRFLMLAGIFLGLSVAVDMDIFRAGTDVEDGLKILGITAYAYYCITQSSDWLSKSVES